MSAPEPATRITAREAAELLGVSKNTLYSYARSGLVPAKRVLRNWVFIREHLEAWLRDGGGDT